MDKKRPSHSDQPEPLSWNVGNDHLNFFSFQKTDRKIMSIKADAFENLVLGQELKIPSPYPDKTFQGRIENFSQMRDGVTRIVRGGILRDSISPQLWNLPSFVIMKRP